MGLFAAELEKGKPIPRKGILLETIDSLDEESQAELYAAIDDGITGSHLKVLLKNVLDVDIPRATLVSSLTSLREKRSSVAAAASSEVK